MNILPNIGAGLDRLISVVSPRMAVKRNLYRQQFSNLTRSGGAYAAAGTTRLTGDWSPVDSNINDIINNSALSVRARVRQLVRDFPYFAAAVDGMVDFAVSDGVVFQSRILKANGKLDQVKIQKVEDAFKYWADEADIAGKLHFYEMQRLSKRQDIECGEFIFIKRYPKDKNRYMPFALQAIEADWLTDYNVVPGKGNQLMRGIEYNQATGQVVRYHFTDPDSWGKSTSVPADQVIHGFETLRPGQIHGISPLAAAVLVAGDLGDLMDSEMDAAKMASKWLAFVESDNPVDRQMALPTDPVTGKKIEELENGIIEYLRQGEKMTIASNPRPGSNFPPYVRLILTMISIVAKVPYEILSGDYRELNYSQGKMVRNDFSHKLKPIVSRHTRQCCQPITKGFFDMAVMSGRLNFKNYMTNPAPFLRCEWQHPGMESIDPSRETKAIINQKQQLLRSPQEICRARGRDYEDVLKEIKAARDLEDEYGLQPEDVSLALANNPAAIDNQK